MPKNPLSGLSSENIIEGSRKRQKLLDDAEHAGDGRGNRAGSNGVDFKNRSPEEVAQDGLRMLAKLMEATDANGILLCSAFLRLPNRRQYPDYYEVIKRPLTLEDVRIKLEGRQYANLEEAKHDCEVVFNNAKRYNMRDSEIWLQAKDLHHLVKEEYARIMRTPSPQPEEEHATADAPAATPSAAAPTGHRITIRRRSPSRNGHAVPAGSANIGTSDSARASTAPKEEEGDKGDNLDADADAGDEGNEGDDGGGDYEGLDPKEWEGKLNKAGKLDGRKRPGPRGKRLKTTLKYAIMELKRLRGPDNRVLAELFETLPSGIEYPEYYKIITKPISFEQIENKFEKREYQNSHALVEDLRVMLDNALLFNEEGSPVWSDAWGMRNHLENTVIPGILADGFTLDPNDMRQSALPPQSSPQTAGAAQKLKLKYGGVAGSPSPVDVDSGMSSASPEARNSRLKVKIGGRVGGTEVVTGAPQQPDAIGLHSQPTPAYAYASTSSASVSPFRPAAPLPAVAPAMSPPSVPAPEPAAKMSPALADSSQLPTATPPGSSPPRPLRAARQVSRPAQFGPVTPLTAPKTSSSPPKSGHGAAASGAGPPRSGASGGQASVYAPNAAQGQMPGVAQGGAINGHAALGYTGAPGQPHVLAQQQKQGQFQPSPSPTSQPFHGGPSTPQAQPQPQQWTPGAYPQDSRYGYSQQSPHVQNLAMPSGQRQPATTPQPHRQSSNAANPKGTNVMSLNPFAPRRAEGASRPSSIALLSLEIIPKDPLAAGRHRVAPKRAGPSHRVVLSNAHIRQHAVRLPQGPCEIRLRFQLWTTASPHGKGKALADGTVDDDDEDGPAGNRNAATAMGPDGRDANDAMDVDLPSSGSSTVHPRKSSSASSWQWQPPVSIQFNGKAPYGSAVAWEEVARTPKDQDNDEAMTIRRCTLRLEPTAGNNVLEIAVLSSEGDLGSGLAPNSASVLPVKERYRVFLAR